MDILVGSSSPVVFSRQSSLSPSIVSPAAARASRAAGRKIRLRLRSRRSVGGFSSLAASEWCNFHGGRLIAVAASSGKNDKKASSGNNKKGGGKAQGNPERKDEKKQAKPSVWSAEFSSGKAELREQSSAAKSSEKDRSDGRRRGGGRVTVVDDVRVQSFGAVAATSSVPAAASERRRSQQQRRLDPNDTLFLRHLSPLLPIDEEILLQPEEPVPSPLFSTFCSNASGVWRGVGATFSPITGDFEPIYLDEDKEDVFDVRVLSTVETLRVSKDGVVLSPEHQSLLRRVSWSLEDPVAKNEEYADDDDDSALAEGNAYGEVDELGYLEDDEDTESDDNSDWEFVLGEPGEIDERWEKGEEAAGFMEEIEDSGSVREDDLDWRSMWDGREVLDGGWEEGGLPAESGSNLTAEQPTSSTSSPDGTSYDDGFTAEDTPSEDVVEEDLMTWEPGLVFFEDGAYSRGPLELLTAASSSSREYINAHTFKVEQCLVAGGHKRLRIIHTVSVEEGEKIEVLHLAVYEEEWMGPCHMKSISDAGGHQLELFSDRARHSPEDIVGKWKVFQVEAAAMHPAKASANEKETFVFSCKETSIKRGFPAMPKLSIQEDESVDLSDFSMSWLTGNVSTYVSLGSTGALTFGVGWVCADGTRLVLERAYGEDGKLVHVNSKSEFRVAQ